MKKLISIVVVGASLLVANQTFAAQAQTYHFLSDFISGFNSTNAAGANLFTNSYGGLTITNGASAPLGGYTNIQSYSYGGLVVGTNCPTLTWTNNLGSWVIPTNGTPATTTTMGPGGTPYVTFVQGPDTTKLTKDIPLYTTENGLIPLGSYVGFATNSTYPGSASQALAEGAMFSTARLACRIYGAASAANTLNLVFIGVPDGVDGKLEDSSLTTTACPTFQWGITAAAGVTSISTNLPIWRFAGCSAIRLRSASLTTTTAANIGVTIQDLALTEFVPIQK